MKRFSLTFISLAIASVAVIMFACKKENEPQTDNFNPNPPETQAVIDHVNAFKSRIEYYKANPAVKDGETESIDDAIYDIEALFNFTYAYPELSYSRTISYDTTLQLPVSNGRVLMTDLTLFYGRMYETVSALYHAAELSDKQFLILDVEAGELHGNTLSVNLHTVQGSVRGVQPPVEPVQYLGPFKKGEMWNFEMDFGGLQGEEGNAATRIASLINEIAVPQAPMGYEYCYPYVVSCSSDIIDMEMPESYQFTHFWFDFSGLYCEFYKKNPNDDDYWLDSDLLNFHYFGEIELAKNRLRADNEDLIPTNYKFFRIEISPEKKRSGNEVQWIRHTTTASYGLQLLVGHGAINRSEL